MGVDGGAGADDGPTGSVWSAGRRGYSSSWGTPPRGRPPPDPIKPFVFSSFI